MALKVAYECDMCNELTKDVFTIVVESDKHHFTFGEQKEQPRIVLSVCKRCLSEVGTVVNNALCS